MRPSRPYFARHLRMRQFLNAINNSPHAEERSGAAGTRLEARTTTDAAHSCPASALYPPYNARARMGVEWWM